MKTPLSSFFRIDETKRKALSRLGIYYCEDLLFHFPFRYGSLASTMTVENAPYGEEVTVWGTIKKLTPSKGFRSKIPMAQGTLSDGTGTLALTFLHQPYIAKMFPTGTYVKVSGLIKDHKGRKSMMNPKIEKADSASLATSDSLFATGEDLIPVYSETRGVSSEWIRHAVEKLLHHKFHETLIDPLPLSVTKKYSLPVLSAALVWIHTPRHKKDAEAARKRFAFQEIFLIQIDRALERYSWEHHDSFTIAETPIEDFLSRLPYPPTHAQERAFRDIAQDFSSGEPMARLLEGDVGSGKTLVAALSAHLIVSTRPKGQNYGTLQVALMAPTEILATQHFESFISFFVGSGLQIGLITGSGCRKFPSKVNPRGWTDISRTQLVKWVENGEIPIVIGTHALIQKTVKWKHLALAIVDEQQRFGTTQRASLIEKGTGRAPHLLSMTATPIPRTLALTLFGDLDISVLDELPAGRKKVETSLIHESERTKMYEMVRTALKEGRQAYVICPRIDAPDPDDELALSAKSVVEEHRHLSKKIFPEYRIAMLHGKMKPKEKDEVMKKFAQGEIELLVATSVVEVGVNVPNATHIIIEGAERYGLSQLHQLRGRVARSHHTSRCFLVPKTSSDTSLQRLQTFLQAQDGFALAEADLARRGSGDIAGAKQWGVSDLGMEALRNLKLVEAARTEARSLVYEDPSLSSHPTLASYAHSERKKIHME